MLYARCSAQPHSLQPRSGIADHATTCKAGEWPIDDTASFCLFTYTGQCISSGVHAHCFFALECFGGSDRSSEEPGEEKSLDEFFCFKYITSFGRLCHIIGLQLFPLCLRGRSISCKTSDISSTNNTLEKDSFLGTSDTCVRNAYGM